MRCGEKTSCQTRPNEPRLVRCTMTRIESIAGPLTIVIDRTPKQHEQSENIERAWQDLCAQNPRYFNGPILAFDSYDPHAGVIHASVEHYKHHAVRDCVDVGISLLAITAVLIACDEDGTRRVLLAQRSPATHRYGGLWELGPSGGVDVPDHPTNTLNHDGIVVQLKREILEETGLKLANQPGTAAVLIHDDAVGSTDIVIGIELPEMPVLERNWEYTDCRWASADEFAQQVQSHPDTLIPTTIALSKTVLPLLR